MMWNFFDDWNSANKESCEKFMKYFHKGVKFQHVGSKVVWEVVEVYKNNPTGELSCKLRSVNSAYSKHITMQDYSDYIVFDLPPAVAVLFGDGND